MNNDYLSLIIDTLLSIIKDCTLVETSDGKYAVSLIKETEDTTIGKAYEISINDKSWTCFDESNK